MSEVETNEAAEPETTATQPPQPQPEKEIVEVLSIGSALESGRPNVHNFVGDNEQTYRFVAKCCGPDTIKSDQIGDDVIDIQYYFAHRVEMVAKEGGEVRDETRIVLIDKSGKMYSFVSGGIVSGVDLLISTFGNVPWNTPLPHRVKPHRTRHGNNMLSLVPA